MNDPLLERLARLPDAAPDPDRIARLRARCHARLARRPPRASRPSARARAGWESVVIGVGAGYVIETMRQALYMYGLL